MKCQLLYHLQAHRTPLRHHRTRHFNDWIQHDLIFLPLVCLSDSRTVIGPYVICDIHTKYLMTFLIEDKHAAAVAPRLIQWYSVFRPPRASWIDNSGGFWKEALAIQQQYSVRIVVSKPYTSESNGGVQKANG